MRFSISDALLKEWLVQLKFYLIKNKAEKLYFNYFLNSLFVPKLDQRLYLFKSNVSVWEDIHLCFARDCRDWSISLPHNKFIPVYGMTSSRKISLDSNNYYNKPSSYETLFVNNAYMGNKEHKQFLSFNFQNIDSII